jgi:hypothetical protein
MKLSNITSFDTLTETLKTPWIEQLKSLDEKYEKWSSSRSKTQPGKLDTSTVLVKHKLLDVNAIGRQRSEICESVLSRKSVFDDHFKRLETISDQQPPVDFVPPRPTTVNNTTRSHSIMAAINPLPNLCSSKPPTTNNVSSSVMKGLQYPFPSHPPLKPAPPLPKLNIPFTSTLSLSSSTKASPLPDVVQPLSAPPVYGCSNQRSSLLLRNNSVEKLTDLPKNTSSVTASREPLTTCTGSEVKKEAVVGSPICSRRNSVESVDRKSTATTDDESSYEKKECRKPHLVNHIDGGKSQCNSILGLCKTTNVEKENSVLDKRKRSFDKTECKNNAVSVIIHTSQKETKLNRSTEDLSEEISKTPPGSRRMSLESPTPKEDHRQDDTNSNNKKITVDTINHQSKMKVGSNTSKHDLPKTQQQQQREQHKPRESVAKVIPFNHVDDVNSAERRTDEKRPFKEPLKSDSLEDRDDKSEIVELKYAVLGGEDDEDEDDEDSNDVDKSKVVTEKNRIIETVFHIKHEKKKSTDGRVESSDEKSKCHQEKKKTPEPVVVISSESVNFSKMNKESADAKKEADLCKQKKDCIRTKEFNMFEHKLLSEKKKNHFLSERRKSIEPDAKEQPSEPSLKSASNKLKEGEVKETKEKDASDKKKEKHSENKPKEKDGCEKQRKPEVDEKYVEKKHESHSSSLSTNAKRDAASKPKEVDKEKELAAKKRDKLPSSHPENGKIKHHDGKRYKDLENHKVKHYSSSSENKETRVEHTETQKNHESKTASSSSSSVNKISKHQPDGVSKLLNRKDSSKERKNSSGSSSLSDSMHSKSNKHSSYDSNNDERANFDVTMNVVESHSSKKLDKVRNNSVVAGDSHSGSKDDRKNNDLLRCKKSEKCPSSASNNASTSPAATTPSSSSNNGNNKKSKKSSKKRTKTPSDSSSDSEFESFDNKKNHSIFDVVLDEPAYISMYDKVKARSTKNLQKQEEEKRQEKLKEKFSQLKQSRVKREEKKRSTSYDDDTDPEKTVSRKANKLILDSSDEEHSGNEKMKVSVPSDSTDGGERMSSSKHKITSDADEEMKTKLKKASRRSKTKEKSKPSLTDSSEDEVKATGKRGEDMYFTKHKLMRLSMSLARLQRNASDPKKIESDLSDDIGHHGDKDKPKSYFETVKMDVDKIYSDFSDDEVKTKQQRAKNATENRHKTKPKNNLKEMISKGELNRMNVVLVDSVLNKGRMLSDVSEEEIVRPSTKEVEQPKQRFADESRIKLEKMLSESSEENESIGTSRAQKLKKCNIYSDDSEADSGVRIKQEVKNDELYYNLAELHHDYLKSDSTPPPLLIDAIGVFEGDVECMKKKSHKKKQKRQKAEHSLERNKKHSKKERRKSVPSDLCDEDNKEKDHKVKQKKKKKNRDKVSDFTTAL